VNSVVFQIKENVNHTIRATLSRFNARVSCSHRDED